MSGREHEALMRARIHVDEEAYRLGKADRESLATRVNGISSSRWGRRRAKRAKANARCASVRWVKGG